MKKHDPTEHPIYIDVLVLICGVIFFYACFVVAYLIDK